MKSLITLFSGLFFLSACTTMTPFPKEQSRIALVIGNADYQFISQLKNPVNDAKGMSKVLEDLGFHVIHEENANRQAMEKAVNTFKQNLEMEQSKGKQTVALFYYSGHGTQYGDENYLLPVAIDTESSNNLDTIFSSDTIALSDVITGMEKAKANMQIVVLDACRDNPFKNDGFKVASKSIGKGLAWIDNTNSDSFAPQGSFIAYATAPNAVAYDEGRYNSPYTKHLLKRIREEGVSIETLFKEVRNAVIEEMGGRQIPWESSSLKSDFYFAGEGLKRRTMSAGFQ